VIYVPSFIKSSSGVQKIIRGDTQTHRQQRDLISLLYWVSRLKRKLYFKLVIAKCCLAGVKVVRSVLSRLVLLTS
jgi:hypothetical protein